MTYAEILEDIRTKAVVPVWPHAGTVLDQSRGAAYAAAGRNEFEVIRIGRSIKVVRAPLRKRLGIEAA